jgi:hypothetical protein
MPVKNEIGNRYGRLTVQRLYDRNKGYARWLCLCDCGQTTVALGTHLRSGNTQSCGCLQSDIMVEKCAKHGWHGTRTYESWQNMIRRCEPGGQYYDKGIKVCEMWKASFNAFLEDMGERPEEYSLERIDPDGDYTLDNCEWIPKSENTIDTYRGNLTRRGKAKKRRVENEHNWSEGESL